MTLAAVVAGVAGAAGGAAAEGSVVLVRTRSGAESVWPHAQPSWLEIRRLDGTGRRSLTRPIGPGERRSDTDPVMSADGRQVAFARSTSGGDALFVVSTDGTGLRRIFGAGAWGFGFAPAGDKLFVSAGTPSASAIYAVRADGAGGRRLLRAVKGGKSQIGAIGWSPDGRRLLYTEVFGEVRPGAYTGPEILRTVVEGGGQTRLLETRDYLGGAAWSPGGDLVAYANGCLEACNLFVVPSTGGAPRALTRFRQPSLPDNAFDQLPFAWVGGDDAILVARGRTLLTVNARTGATRRVVELPVSGPGGEEEGATVDILSVSLDGASALVRVEADFFDADDVLHVITRQYVVVLGTGRLSRVSLPSGWAEVRLD